MVIDIRVEQPEHKTRLEDLLADDLVEHYMKLFRARNAADKPEFIEWCDSQLRKYLAVVGAGFSLAWQLEEIVPVEWVEKVDVLFKFYEDTV